MIYVEGAGTGKRKRAGSIGSQPDDLDERSQSPGAAGGSSSKVSR